MLLVLSLVAGLRQMKGPEGRATTLTCVHDSGQMLDGMRFFGYLVLLRAPETAMTLLVHVSISEGPLQPQQL